MHELEPRKRLIDGVIENINGFMTESQGPSYSNLPRWR